MDNMCHQLDALLGTAAGDDTRPLGRFLAVIDADAGARAPCVR